MYSKCVLEHLKNPGFALKEMVRVLKKGGIIEIITDNASYWYYALDNSTHTGKYELSSYGKRDRHYSLFTDWHLINHFRDIGLKVLKIEYQENTGSPRSLKGKIVVIINKFLKHTPLKRMAYGRIRIIGKKLE